MTESFDTIWEEILRCLRNRRDISTLTRRERNEIIAVNNDAIIVKSEKTGTERVLKREEIRFAVEKLLESGTLSPEDLSPRLIGKRAIILAILFHCLPHVERVTGRSSIRYLGQRQNSD